MAKEMTQDERIKEILKWGPMSALYFTVAVDVLNQVLDQKDDDFVFDLFGRMIPAATIRRCVARMNRTLNPQ